MAVSEKVRQLAETYTSLTNEERQEFATLVASGDDLGVNQEWITELRSRANDIDSGRVELVDGEDFLRRLSAI